MGTRGAYGFYKNGEDKITYNHYDSYPDCLGTSIVDFIKNTSDKEMNEIFDKIELVEESSEVTDEQFNDCKKFLGDLSGHEVKEWYNLLRKAQGDLSVYKEDLKYMIGGYEEFIRDSLFCEYSYVLNLDDNTLEFYIGFQDKPTPKNRYSCENPYTDMKYYNCKLARIYPFDTIRKYSEKTIDDMNNISKENNE